MRSTKDIIEICEILDSTFKNPKSELQSVNEYTFLVAVVLSAQATDKQVNTATDKLFAIAQTPHDMLDIGYERLCDIIHSVGFYKTKAKHVLKLSMQLIESFDGQVPRKREDLMTLAGVGRKTANVVLNQLFEVPAIAVDTHVYRVSRRLELSDENNVDDVEMDLENAIPAQYKQDIGNRLILFGRYICKARNPSCSTCPLSYLCNNKAT